MYCDFFGLRCLPFEDRADTNFYYPTPSSDEALAAMEYEVRFGKGLALILGEAGLGKTLLIRALLSRFHSCEHAVVLTCPANGDMDLMQEVCKGLGVALPTSRHRSRRRVRLRHHLLRSAHADHRSILIVDQAENLTDQTMAQLATLADLEHDHGRLLKILLVGQPRLRPLLARPEFAGVRQRLFGERNLSPLTPLETQDYIRHRLRMAGAGDAELFEAEATTLIHRAAGGVPRLVNHLCNAGLLAAYGARQSRVTLALTHEVAGDAPDMTTMSASADALSAAETKAPAVAPARLETLTPWEQSPFLPEANDSKRFIGFTSSHRGTPIAAPLAGAATTSAGASHRGDVVVDRLERALERMERMGADASAEPQATVDRHVAALMDSTERMADRLNDSSRSAAHSLERIEQQLQRILADAERRMEVVEARAARISAASTDAPHTLARVEQAGRRAEEIENRLTSMVTELVDQATVIQERMALLLGAVETGRELERKLKAAAEHVATVSSDAQAQVDAMLNERLREKVDAARRTHEETLDASMTTHRTRLDELVDQSTSRARMVESTILAAQQKHELARLEWDRSLTASLDAAEHRIQAMERRGADMAVRDADADAAAALRVEQLTAASAKVGQLCGAVKRVQTSLEQILERAETSQAHLSDAVQDADKRASAAQTVCDRVEESRTRITTTLAELPAEYERVHSEALHRAEQSAQRLTAAHAQSEALSNRLNDLLADAGPLSTNLETLVASASQTTSRLEPHSAAAGRLLAELAEANHNARRAIDRTDESIREAGTARDEAIAIIDRLRPVIAAAEASAKQVTEGNNSAAHLAERLRTSTETAGHWLTNLNDGLSRTRQHLDQIADRCADADKVADRLGDLGRALITAKDAEASIRQTLASAAAAREQLATDAQLAATRSANLQELTNSAEGLITAQENLHMQGESVIETLDQRVTAARAATETSENLLQEFFTQTEGLTSQLTELHEKAAGIDENMVRLAKVPAEIVTAAQAQTAHLEQVCTVAKKVFSGLAKTALAALQQTNDFQQASGLAAERLRNLTQQTQSASKTLCEWVEEAARVQNRLERTLDECPPIAQTHPGEAVLKVARAVVPIPGGDDLTGGGPWRPPNEASQPGSQRQEQVVKATSRAEEVARLIEEAKRAPIGASP